MKTLAGAKRGRLRTGFNDLLALFNRATFSSFAARDSFDRLAWAETRVHSTDAWRRRRSEAAGWPLRLLVGIWTVGVLFSTACAGEPSPQPSVHFDLQEWGVADGLSGAHVNAITQDADGFIWAATLTGLLRFDGHSFEVFDEASGTLPSNRLTVIHTAPNGDLWIGSEQGHLARYRQHRLERLADPPYAGSRVATLAVDGRGDVWMSRYGNPANSGQPLIWQWTEAGLRPRPDLNRLWSQRAEDGSVVALASDGSTFAWPEGNPVVALSRDSAGDVWGQFPGGRMVRLRDGLSDPMGPSYLRAVGSISTSMLTAQHPDRIDVFEAATRKPVSSFPEGPTLYRVDRRGLSWVALDNRLLAYRSATEPPVFELDVQSLVRGVFEDREGGLWVSTMTRGILHLTESIMQTFGPEQGVPLPGALGLTGSGQVFMEPAPAGPCNPLLILRSDGSKVSVDRPVPGCGWLLDDRAGGRWRLQDRRLRWKSPRAQEQAFELTPHWMLEDPLQDSVIWAFDDRAALRIDATVGGQAVVKDRWPMVANRALVADADGGRWIGAQSGLWHFHGNRWDRFGREQGLPVDNVRALLPDGKGGLWLGTYGGGLVHFDRQRFVTLGLDRGLPESVVSTLIEDRFGAIWYAGNRGIYRIHRQQLEQALNDPQQRIIARSFTAENGLSNPETSGLPGLAGPDGRLWLATFGGLVVINPALIEAQEKALPQVHVQSVTAAGRSLPGSDELIIEANAVRDLTVRFTAIYFAAPRSLEFRYRMDPLDQRWIESSQERVAQYRDLPPGKYRFRVQGRHPGGEWVEAASTSRVWVQPRFTETAVFKLGLVLAGLALLAVAWRYSTGHIRRRAEALEAAVQQRTHDLQTERDVVATQAERLARLAEARAQFMAGISHELRTPLTLILGPLLDMRDERLGALPTAARREVDTALRHAERLQRLVDRLLGHARSEAALSRLQCREHTLQPFIESIVEELRPLAMRRSIELCVKGDVSSPLWFDAMQMESVLINLIANAIKYSPPGSAVAVALAQTNASWAQISVRDNGPGIPEQDVPLLFERFFRGSASGQQAEGGFGLGLALVREIVERHGGRIDVETSVGGSVFHVHLRIGKSHLRAEDLAPFDQVGTPQQSAVMAAQVSEPASPLTADTDPAFELEPSKLSDSADNDQTTLLIVDDNEELRRLVRRQLQPDYRVIEAADGEQALAILRQQLPDLIISDIMMPRLSGIELCQAIRRDPDIAFLPVLLLTAKASADSRIEGLDEGADGYLAKPFDRGVLRATIANLLASRRRLRDYYAAKAMTPALDVVAAQDARPSDVAAAPGASLDERHMQRTRAVLEARLHDEGFGVDQLAEALHQSRVSLYRHSKRLFDRSPSGLIREARLQRAHQLLSDKQGSVSEIAYGVGFKSVAHFSNSFRQRYGCSPSSVAHPAATSDTDFC